jgi:hypothetical protein
VTERIQAAVTRIAQIFENSAPILPHTNPLVSLCLFITLRYLLTEKTGYQSQSISTLKLALSKLAIRFPAVGQFQSEIKKTESRLTSSL